MAKYILLDTSRQEEFSASHQGRACAPNAPPTDRGKHIGRLAKPFLANCLTLWSGAPGFVGLNGVLFSVAIMCSPTERFVGTDRLLGEAVVMRSNRQRQTPRHGVLQGKRVLVTRARAQAGDLVRQLQALGALPIVVPTIDIVPPADAYAALDAALRDLSTFDWVVFTSVNGVLHVWERLAALGFTAHVFASVRVAAIGPATAEALRSRQIHVALVPERYVAEALLDALPHPAGQRFLLPRAAGSRDTLRTGLEAAGAEVIEVHAYQTIQEEPSSEAFAALDTGVDVLTFTSSSTVRNFWSQMGPERTRRLAAQARVVAIGPITAATARALGLQVDAVASDYTIAGLIDALIDLCQ
jgi:uroporphyrinogen-III synthase